MISKEKNNNKFLFILGPTGIGKTFVSLNISKKLNGIIINSDAFSLYKEADIMTAKATEEEKKISVHKLIDVLDLTEINFNQNDYKHLFFNEIKNEENKIFVIVGGTNYYVESILFKENEEEEKNKKNYFEKENEILFEYKNNNKNNNYKEIFDFIIELKNKYKNYENENNILYNNINSYLNSFYDKNKNNEFLFKLLSIIDYEYFNFLHKNDIRRIINVLSFYFTYNYKKSLNINNNKSLNFSDCKFIILLPENINELKTQIINRIKTMIFNKGINEIFYIFKKFQKNGINIDFNKGVLQAIGYKEFYKLYTNFNNENVIEENYNNYFNNKEKNNENIINIINNDNNLKNIFNECLDELIKNTFNYAKYQIKFIKNRIIPFINQNKTLIINIENYNKEFYIENILKKIFDFIENKNSIINNENNNIEFSNNNFKNWKKFYCEKCNKEMNGEYEFNNHMKSNKHKKFKNKNNNIIK